MTQKDFAEVVSLLEAAYAIANKYDGGKYSTEHYLGNDIYTALGRCKQIKPVETK